MKSFPHQIRDFFKPALFVPFCGVFAVIQPVLSQASAVSFEQAYQSALSRTETVATQESRTGQASERVSQNKGALLPHLSANASYMLQDNPDVTSYGDLANFIDKTEQTNVRFTLTQSVFHGFKDSSLIRAAEADLNAQKFTEIGSRYTLYSSVAQAYYGVLAAEKDVRNLNSQLAFTKKREDELRGRTKRGRSRIAELLTAESQSLLVKAQIQAAEVQMSQAREQFAYVTGLGADSALSDPEAALPSKVENLDVYLQSAESRPDIASLRYQVTSAEETRTSFKSQYWPFVDLIGDYYPRRSGSLQNSRWDFGLTLSWNIFDGGTRGAQVNEAAGKIRERELQLEQGRRAAQKDIKTAYQSVTSGLSQLVSLGEAVKKADETYRQQSFDYSNGLTTNLDVLQALNSLTDAQRAYDRTNYQTLAAWAALLAASGKAELVKSAWQKSGEGL